MDEIVFYGEEKCGAIYASGVKKGEGCQNGAYYLTDDGHYRCGVHSKKDQRTELKKNPNAAKDKSDTFQSYLKECVKDARLRLKNGEKGKIASAKLRMRQAPPSKDMYVPVFPNFKHGNRSDGIGASHLSPMYLGPIKHGQPGLPNSLNLENFHQFSKVFESEIDEDGVIQQSFYDAQIKAFKDATPHRHKSKEKCVGWLWKTKTGEEKLLSYIECRQFYCNFYERLASQEDEFVELKTLVSKGVNLLIIGYDGFDVDDYRVQEKLSLKDKLEALYLDPKQPFGHELCLLTMLSLDNPDDYPWRKHKTEDF